MEQLVIIFVPALIAVLLSEENKLGRAITKEEAEEIRDNAGCIQVPLNTAIDLTESRGYDDVRPEFVWEDWQEYKTAVKKKAEE